MQLDPKSLELYVEELIRKAGSLRLSRRRFLQSAVGLAGSNAVPFGMASRVQFRVEGNRAVFLLDGEPRWTVDPAAFAGTANLTILRNTAHEVAFSLADARYPGTLLFADMRCIARRNLSGWICEIDLPAYGQRGSIDLVSWLTGRPLRFTLKSALNIFGGQSPFDVTVRQGLAELDASWSLGFDTSTFVLPTESSRMRAGRTSLQLASEDRHPLLGVQGKGSSVSILRNEHRWQAESAILKRNQWKLAGPSEPFQSAQIDAFESSSGVSPTSIVFAPAQGSRHTLHLPGSLRHPEGQPFALSLDRPSYALIADGNGALQETFTSPLLEEAVAVGPSRAFRFAKRVSITTNLDTPGATDVIDSGLQQIYCEQFPADQDTIFDLIVSGDHAGLIGCSSSIPMDDLTLRVTRPQDFLHLDFTFANVQIEFRSNLPYLIPKDGRQPVMIVHFPPQHQQEETFEEGPNGVADGPTPVRPVEISLSGPTRLAFDLPIDSHGLALNVENLLAWSNYTMRAPGDVTGLPTPDDDHQTVIEMPTRLFLQSAEQSGKTTWNHATFADQTASPLLWHTELQAQTVKLVNARRATNIVSLKFPAPPNPRWEAGQTIGILDPIEFAGVFIIKSVDTTQNTITFAQNGSDIPWSSITLSVANRFVAYSAADYAPPVTSFAWQAASQGQLGPGTTTITFASPVTFQVGDVINVSDSGQTLQSCCKPEPAAATDGILGVFLIDTVSGNTLTYQSAKNTQPHPNLFVSMLSAQTLKLVSGAAGQTSVTLTTTIANCIRVGESVYVFKSNTPLDGLTYLKAASVSDDGFSVTVNLLGSLTNAVSSSTGLVVPYKLYPISQDDRRQLIDLDQQTNEPRPLAMEQLILSAIGAWTIFDGNFDPLAVSKATKRPYDVQKVIYRVAQGRDYFVEVDYKGYLWPFGHNATLLKVTKRVFYSVYAEQQPVDPHQNICYLRTQFFVAVLEKTRVVKTLPGNGNEIPFTRIDVDTEITPALFAGSGTSPFSACMTPYFWPSMADKQPYPFAMTGYDSASPAAAVPFSIPVMFVASPLGTTAGSLPQVLTEYLAEKVDFRTASFGGQSVHFAPSLKAGDTEQHTGSMTFTATILYDQASPYDDPITYQNDGEDYIAFRPVLDYANVDVPAVRVFSGVPAAGSSGSLVQVKYPKVYVYNSFGSTAKPNATQTYLEIQGNNATLQYPGPQGGGMATPTASMKGLSRNVGNTAKVPPANPTPTDNTFDPVAAFGSFEDSTLLGCIKLKDVIAVIGDIGSNLNLLPTLNLDQVFAVADEVIQEIATIKADILAAQAAFASLDNAIQNPLQVAAAAIQSAMYKSLTQNAFPTLSQTQPQIAGAISSLEDLYNQYATAFQACLQEMQDDAGCASVLLQSDLDLLRAAGDINLLTDQLAAVSTAANPIIVLTEQDCYKKLSQDIVTAAVAPLNPLALPAKRIELTLGNIASAFDALVTSPGPGPINNVLTQVASLIQQLRDFIANVAHVADQTYLTSNFYANYLQNQKATIKTALANNIATLRSTLLATVNSHFAAFQQVRSNYNCFTVTAAYKAYSTFIPTAQAFIQNAQTLAIDTVNAAIDTAVSDLVTTLANTAISSGIVGTLSSTIGTILSVEALYQQVMQTIETPIAVSAHYTLAQIPLQDAPPGAPIFLAHRETDDGQIAKSVLEIDATVSAQAIPAAPTSVSLDYSTSAGIYDFSLQLLPGLPFITVQFENFVFNSSKGSGSHSSCKLDSDNPVILGDALGFVAGLADAFGPLAGDGGDGPILQVSGTGIGVGYEFDVPDIEAGGFQVIGLDFSALLTLSFTGDPLKLQFYLARPESHFLISAGIYGGGGFLGLELSSAGVDDVSGAMEFGATTGIDITVATGEVHIFGGIYFDFGDNRCVLTGYVRAGGSLDVIDILTLSVEFYIGLTYENDKGQSSVYGTCTVTVSISILFFSADVSLTMQWTWAGSSTSNSSAVELAHASAAALPASSTSSTTNDRIWPEPFWKTYTAAFAKR